MNRHVSFDLFLALMLLAAFAVPAQLGVGVSLKGEVINAALLLKDVEILSADDMEGRSMTRPAMQKARDYVLKRFRESGLTPMGTSFEQEFQLQNRTKTETYKAVNYVGAIKGKKTPDKYIIITAHYDHLGIQNNEIYNGADDDASGTAALFAIAKAFERDHPNHSIIFVAFDGEERGLRGSRYFVEHLPVKREDILLNINMDMISRNEKGELFASGGFHYPALKPTLNKAVKAAKVKLLLGHDDPKLGRDDWTNQSDHGAFHAVKIPFVYFGVEDHADYHRPTDDFANIMPEFYVHAVETVLRTARLFDKDLYAK